MSRFVTMREDGTIEEEVESLEICKYRLNDICCCEESEYLGCYMSNCDSKKLCKNFTEEDGIINE